MSTKCPKCSTNNTSDSKFCKKCAQPLSSPEAFSVSQTKTLMISSVELKRGSIFARRYEIIEELGKGGMGRVYRVEDKKVKEEIALKLIKPEIAADKNMIDRFRNELTSARKIRHKNICGMFDLGEEKGTYFITMEYVPGEDLQSFIRRSGQLALGTTIKIARQICEGLSEAHSLDVIHRDLKPSNIMIDKAGTARIMDFGIARSLKAKDITDAGVMIGTPEYMSPEQAEAKEVDQRSDLYSLGVILYEMTTGRLPFKGDTPLSVAIKHKEEKPKEPRLLNSQIPENLSWLILRCLEKDREKRPQKADDLLSALIKIEQDFPYIEKTGEEQETKKEKKWKDSIGVLPFTDLSPQKNQEYFCDGLTEELINALTQIKELRVVARTSAFYFKGKNLDIREIGEKLMIETVLEGSVRKAGNRLRITAQLINVSDGYHIWSEQYNRETGDVFAIQDDISLSIVNKLKVRLLGSEKEKLVKRHTDNIEAFDLYIKGRYFWNKRTAASLEKAIKYFQDAINIDPSFAPAYSGLSDSIGVYSFYGFLPPNEAFPKAKSAAQKALEIDNFLAEAHASIGYVGMFYDWDWPIVEKSYKRAIELNPGYASAHHFYAGYLAIMGRFEESLSEMKQALELDPLSIRLLTELGNYFRWSGQLDKSMEQLKKVLEMDSNFGMAHMHIGLTYALKKKYDKAITALQKARTLMGNSPGLIGFLGQVYVLCGQKDKAENVLYDLIEMSKKRYVNPMSIALIYAELEEYEKAFEWGEKAFEEHDGQLALSLTWPEYEKIRSIPKFNAILRQIGFGD